MTKQELTERVEFLLKEKEDLQDQIEAKDISINELLERLDKPIL